MSTNVDTKVVMERVTRETGINANDLTEEMLAKTLDIIDNTVVELKSLGADKRAIGKIQISYIASKRYYKKGEKEKVYSALDKGFSLIDKTLADIVDNTIQQARDIVERAAKAGAETSEAENLLSKAEEERNAKRYKECVELAKRAIDVGKNAYLDFLNETLKVVKDRLARLDASGGDISGIVDTVKEAEMLIRNDDYEHALADLTKCLEYTLNENKMYEEAGRLINVAKEKISKLSRIGDNTRAKQLLASAEEAYRMRRSKRALETIQMCIEETEKTKKEYDEAIDTLLEAQTKIEQLKQKGISPGTAEELLETAKISIQEGNVSMIMKYAKDAVKEADSILKSHGIEYETPVAQPAQAADSDMLLKSLWEEDKNVGQALEAKPIEAKPVIEDALAVAHEPVPKMLPEDFNLEALHAELDMYISSVVVRKIVNHCVQYAFGEQKLECMGFMLGDMYIYNGKRYTVVRDVVTTDLDATAISVKFSREGWDKLFEQMDSIGKNYDYLLVGWYHSHPDYSCYLSDTDINTQKRMFKNPHQIAVVCDPVRMEMKGFRLKDDSYEEISYAVYEPDEQTT